MIFYQTLDESALLLHGRISWLSVCLEALPGLQFSSGNQSIGSGIEVKSVEYRTAQPSPCTFETHRDHIDVQVCLEGRERILLERRSNLVAAGEWDEKGDVIFYENPERPGGVVTMTPGSVLVLFPEDAHRCGEQVGEESESLRKFVFKVPRSMWV